MSAPIIRSESIVADGLLKDVFEEGEGNLPVVGDEIQAHYVGRLLDGTVFDSSRERGKPFKFVLGQGQVIRGWDEGFATMRCGEKAMLVCRPEFAYGTGGQGPIPPNSTLRFEVELISFGPKSREPWELSNSERLAEADKAKEAGNAAYVKGNLDTAVEEYHRGLDFIQNLREPSMREAAPLQVTLNSNLSMVYLKLKVYAAAEKSASAALSVDAAHVKSLFRRACARAELKMFGEAKADLLAAAKLAPSDAIKAEMLRLNGLIKLDLDRERKAFGGWAK